MVESIESFNFRKVIILMPITPMGSNMISGIARYSRLFGPWTFYRRPPYYLNQQSPRSLIAEMKNFNADGVIMTEQEPLDEILELKLPTVVYPVSRQSIPGAVNIISDSKEIGAVAAEHLLDRGFKQFAYCGFRDMFWSKDRGKAFEERIRRNSYDVSWYENPRRKNKGSWQYEQPYLIEWLQSIPKPVGLMACNDDRGEHVIETCRIAGIKIPEAVAVIGVDNDETICELANPPLTSVSLHSENYGYMAAKILDQLMRGKKTKELIVMRNHNVVQRQSTDVLAMEDQIVASAIRFIRNNRHRIIQVNDVVEAMSVSRRSMEIRFQRALGCSINKEIRKVRVEQIAHMLRETNFSIAQIAAEFGYTEVSHIARYFKAEMKISPQQYRKQYLYPD